MIPIKTSIQPSRTPYANYLLIAANIIIFFLTYSPHIDPVTRNPEVLKTWAEQFMLIPLRPNLWQFVSYAFLHGGLMHIGGNMFFLYLFGSSVNDKLGSVGYLCFYLAGAVFSGIGHTMMTQSPVLGASGAVAAVTGAYLVLFPQTVITVVYWVFFIGTMDLPAIYFIAIKMIILDNVIIRYTPNVAYDAHLSGYAFGILASIGLLATGLTKSTGFDLWSMLKQWNRRRVYRDSIASGYDPYTGLRTKPVKIKEVEKNPAQQQNEKKILELRCDIADRIGQRNLASAADLYLQLMDVDNRQILPHKYLLDIANELAGSGRHSEAAIAYEQILNHYQHYQYNEQVELMLGIIYSRYLNNPQLAVKYLENAQQKLSDQAQLQMCRQELQKLRD